jgi:RNase adapter protein RapZ
MPGNMRFIMITGLSGAGKSETVKCFEDLGYFCVDNLPPILIPKFAELCAQSDGRINRIALVVDIRGGSFFDDIFEALETLERNGFSYEILFLEAKEEILIRRFKESRRRHPLSATGGITEGIRAELARLEQIRGKATRIIDTSEISARGLREIIHQNYDQLSPQEKMLVTIVSFGFKKGIPLDADLVFDVRFLPNPHYVDSLRNLDGNEAEVANYVLKWPLASRFLTKLYDFVDFLGPQYIKEGKTNLIIGIGCTGGQHRSVTVANKLGDFLRTRGYRVVVDHRDVHHH